MKLRIVECYNPWTDVVTYYIEERGWLWWEPITSHSSRAAAEAQFDRVKRHGHYGGRSIIKSHP